MSELTIEKKYGKLVDSRVLAKELGIEYKTLKETIKTNKNKLTIKSQLRFETLKGKELPQGGVSEKVYWLNEQQATFVMMLSINTLQVVEAKLKLADAFIAAKKALLNVNPETLAYTVKDYLKIKRVSEDHLNTVLQKALMLVDQSKQAKLSLKNKEYLFIGNNISYLDQALKIVLGLD